MIVKLYGGIKMASDWELAKIRQELRIQNMLSILTLTMRTYSGRDVANILAKVEENPDKKFNELVNEILREFL